MPTIHQEVAKGSQDLRFSETIQSNGVTIRVSICSDSHESQSHARVHVFSTALMQWNLLGEIHYSNMKTEANLYYRPERHGPQMFKKDRDHLVKLASDILCVQFR